MPRPRQRFLILTLLILLAGSLASCGAPPTPSHTFALSTLDAARMPPEVQAAPVTVQSAYGFAAANPELLKQIPCYCGCQALGHTSNYACYVSGLDSAGQIIYDLHATACSVCVDITRDTQRLAEQGQSVEQMRVYLATQYAKYGPATTP